MDLENRNILKDVIEFYTDEQLIQVIMSNPVVKDQIGKIKLRLVKIRGEVKFQAEEFTKTQTFHKNMSKEEANHYLMNQMICQMKQAEIISQKGQAHILVSKKGKITIKDKKKSVSMVLPSQAVADHNRKKRYILQEGIPVPFLQDLGIMTADGKVVKSKYDKFRQINRFLELIEDVLPQLNKNKINKILDFGCGKSYLTFAMYYYLHELNDYSVKIIGLDLKQDVIEHCNQLSSRYGYENLEFYCRNIKDYEQTGSIDMVVSLHACDTATDYALAKAVEWGASVILAVPCCQHELNKQMENQLMEPVFQYGLIKERMAALYTDGLRAEILENQGYRTQILEFIDMEHTPKNLLIRAVKQKGKKQNTEQINQIQEFLGVKSTLSRLLMEQE